MAEKFLRQYEVSIWTLYDDFVTVLSNSANRTKGSIQNPIMILNVDGTQEFSFSVPMYYDVNGVKYENPSWSNIKNETIILNTRKIKVILNKKTEEEEIYEFAIDKVTERHEQGELYCDVECTGLAFYELGKVGYKISLSSETFYDEDLEWFNNGGSKAEQPIANIQYWLNQFLPAYSDDHAGKTYSNNDAYTIQLDKNTKITQSTSPVEKEATKWYYAVQLNWDFYPTQSNVNKNLHRIYEEQNYNDNDTMNFQEKARMVDLEESNIYNLTQDIAQIFSVYCKYVYSHDENYRIIARTIVFYNNFLDNNDLSITYRGETQSITKELDSADLVTKLYVKTTNDDNEVNIIDADENDIGEDFLLDFDYLYSIKNVSQYGYEYIPTYKAKLKILNSKLRIATERRILIENKIPGVKARKTSAEDAVKLDQENIDTTNRMIKELSGGTGIFTIDGSKPDSAALLKQGNAGDYFYYINIHRHGVIPSTVKIYRGLNNSAADINSRLTEQINTAIPVFDEYGNLIQMKNIYWREGNSKIVFLTYQYEPEGYFKNITNMWLTRLNQDREELTRATNELNNLETQKTEVEATINSLINEKKAENEYFSRLVGPALREGYWQPEDYIDRGNAFTASYNLGSTNSKVIGGTKYDAFLWDDNLFEGEQDIYYLFGALETKTYYPCINLSNVWDKIKTRLDEYSFIFNDDINITSNNVTDGTRRSSASTLRSLAFNSEAKIIFVRDGNNTIIPVLLLIGAETYSNETLINMRNNGIIGILNTTISGTNITFNISNNSKRNWKIDLQSLTLNSSFNTVYPRIRIESSYLKEDDSGLSIRYANTTLNKYEDYYINTRADESDHVIYQEETQSVRPLVSSKYITLKPETVVHMSDHKDNVEIYFVLSDAAAYIYKDAQLVIKENSRPRVSYTLNLDIFKKNVIKQPSHLLNHIIRINDNELKFKNVLGYVSGVTLSLDRPWEDEIEVKNYKTKYEDLFATIVAQTEEMKKTSYIADAVYGAFTVDGSLRGKILQNALNKVDLNYAFNNGRLTIDEANGIWGRSDSGVVAYRGGGIFTATEQDTSGNWIWNTGLTPEGINANLITTGQLDTAKVKIYAGDRARFQLNEEGLFGYKSFFEDFDIFYNTNYVGTNASRDNIVNKIKTIGDIDPAQFVRFDENGLFLVAKEGAFVLNSKKTDYIVIGKESLDTDDELKRVAISWDGLTLRNLDGKRVFYADSDNGDLLLEGNAFANGFYIITGKDEETNNYIKSDIGTYVYDKSILELQNELKQNRNVGLRVKNYINAITGMIAGKHLQTMESAPATYTDDIAEGKEPAPDAKYKVGDYFYAKDGRVFVYIETDEVEEDGNPKCKWDLVTTLFEDTKASMIVDAINGNIRLFSEKTIDMLAANENDSSILSIKPEGITMGTSKEINFTSGGGINIATNGTFTATAAEQVLIASSNWNDEINDTDEKKKNSSNYIWMHTIQVENPENPSGAKINKEVLEIGTDDLRIKSNGNFIVDSGANVSINAKGSISLLSGPNSGIHLSEEGIEILSDAHLNIQAGSLMITGTGASSGKNIGKYVSDEIDDKTKNSIIGVDVEYNSNKDPKNPPPENDSNWNTTAPEWNEEKYIWQRTVTTINELDKNGKNKKVYSEPTCISGANGQNGAPGAPGDNGYNQVTLYLYKRAASTPSSLSTGDFTYNFSNGTLSPIPSGWSRKIEEGTDPCWFISASVISRDTTVYFDYTKWTDTVTKLVENGIGINGLNTATIYLYQRSASEPNSKPTNITYTFSNGNLTGTLGNWSTTIKSDTAPCWVIAAKAIANTDTYTISSADDWTDPIKLVENGINGLNQATIYLYQRASDVNKPTIPTTSATYTFANGNLINIPEGWVRDIPTGTDPCWVISGIAISNDDTDEISEWTQPEKLVENGVNTATVYLYRRGNTQPTTDNGMMPNKKITYNFSQKKITTSNSNLNGWKTIIPTDDGTPCWVISAVASSNTNTDTIAIAEWGTKAIKFVESGINGLNRATVYLYQWGTSSTSAPSKPSGILTYHFENGTITEKSNNAFNGWAISIPEKPNENYPCYITSVAIVAAANETTYDIAGDDWAKPVEFIKYGTDGTSVKILGSYESEEALKQAHPTGFEGDAYIVGKKLYVWVQNEKKWKDVGQIQGEQGEQGPAGTSRYIFIRYAETDLTGESLGTLSEIPTDKTMYIGIANRDKNSAPANPSAYTWSRYVGLNSTVITLYKRSATAPTDKPTSFDYSFSSGIEDEASYLNGWSSSIPTDDGNPCWAITATALSPSDTDTIEDTEWTENPVKIVQSGTNAVVYNLTCNPNVIVDSGSAFSPTSFTVSATSINGNATPKNYKGRFTIQPNNKQNPVYTSATNEYYTTYTPTTYDSSISYYTVTLYKANGTTTILDTQTIPIIKEGKNGTDSYTVMLSNESHTFAGSVSAAIASTVTSNIIAYKGATQVAVTIGTITGAPTGMTVTSAGSGGTNARIEVTVNTSLTTKQGIINIPVTVEGKSFMLHFSWALALAGNSVSEIKEQYYIANSSVTINNIPKDPNSSDWKDECPSWSSGKTIWTSSLVTWENGTKTRTDPVKAEGINSANETANNASKAVTQLDRKLNQEEIFNRLTNNSSNQGIFLEDGRLYINGEYIKALTLSLGGAENIGGTLIVHDDSDNIIGYWDNTGLSATNCSLAGQLTTTSGYNKTSIEGGRIRFGYKYGTTSHIFTSFDEDVSKEIRTNFCFTKQHATDYVIRKSLLFGNDMSDTSGPGLLISKAEDTGSGYYDYILMSTGNRKASSIPHFTGYASIRLKEENGKGDIEVWSDNMHFYSDYYFFYGKTAQSGIDGRVYIGKELTVAGDLIVNGSKARVVDIEQYSTRKLYCYETPTPFFGDIGEGIIGEDGLCYINIDPIFLETITTNDYQVFLQTYEKGEVYIKKRFYSYFIVEGTPNLRFGWEIKAKQKEYEQLRLDLNDSFAKTPEPSFSYGQEAAEYIKNLQQGRINL